MERKTNIFTSYYGGHILHNRDKQLLVSVSNGKPAAFVTDLRWDQVLPDWDMLVKPYKEGRLDAEGYYALYYRSLTGNRKAVKATLDKILSMARERKKDVVLLCFERPGAFCHRHVLADWLGNELGLNVKELGEEEKLF